MSARMEKVREALDYNPADPFYAEVVAAARVEVEEWEADRNADRSRVAEATANAVKVGQQDYAGYGEIMEALTARVEAAEAEVERWHREALDWQQAKSEADDACDHAAARAEAAEAEADRLRVSVSDACDQLQRGVPIGVEMAEKILRAALGEQT